MHPLLSAFQSVVAAFFGVQSEGKRESDFKQHSPVSIIIIAITLFFIFIAAIFAVVSWVLST
jgi:flagellar basal body-associated protein FliL